MSLPATNILPQHVDQTIAGAVDTLRTALEQKIGAATPSFVSRAALELADVPAVAQRVGLLIGESWVDAVRVSAEPAHALKAQGRGGQWWELRPNLITPDMAASPAEAATAAYKMSRSLAGPAGVVIDLPIDPAAMAAAATDQARHAVIQGYVDWAERNLVTASSEVRLVLPAGGWGVYGQLSRGTFETGGHSPPIVLRAGSVQTVTVQNIAFGAKRSEVVYVSVSNGGAGYTAATVAFSGGGGAGATATAKVAGGKVVGIVVTAGGSSWTSAPTVTISGDGAGAAATATINRNIVEVTATLSALPTTIAIGQPFGMRGLTYDSGSPHDGDWCSGGGVVKSFNAGAKTIVYDTTCPSVIVPSGGAMTAGSAVFPATWLKVSGGYTGKTSGKEGYINASQAGSLKLQNIMLAWVDGEDQADKGSQSGIHTGMGSARAHLYGNTGVIGFPNHQIRIVQGWLYGSSVFLAGGKTGENGFTLQNGGFAQTPSLFTGGFSGDAITIGDGCYYQAASGAIGASSRGLYVPGGQANYQLASIAGCVTGVYSNQGGETYLSTTVAIRRCSTGIRPESTGVVIGSPTFDRCTANAFSGLTINTWYQGGGWFGETAADARVRAAGVDVQAAGTLTFGAGASIVADKGTATDAGSGVTVNKMAGVITTQSLTTAAGASTTITVNNSLATAASVILLTRVGGTNTAGLPRAQVSSRAAGAFTLRVDNDHASAAFNGTLAYAFMVA